MTGKLDTYKGKLVKEYLINFPTSPSLTLAKRIFEDHPKDFSDIENVRMVIRWHRGCRGILSRKNPFRLPDSDITDYVPFQLPIACDNILVLADLHIPWHDLKAITAAMQWGQKHKVNTILINGDLLESEAVGRFIKSPRHRDYESERNLTLEFLDCLRDAFPLAVIYFKYGNHDERLEKYFFTSALNIFGLPEFELEFLLGLHERSIIPIKNRRYIKAGKLPIYHGHEFQSGAGTVNPARTLFLKTFQCGFVNHSHRTSEHSQRTADGELITTWSGGCLCWLNPEWQRINQWNHGFANLRTEENGEFKVTNLRIENGEVY